jgi:sterol desaturase/sphingolipid hydroxylase (fatty acid hydroxylase superfamily)
MMLEYIFIFILWTLVLYLIHRLVHITPVLKELHWDHHKYVNLNDTGWRLNNLLLFNDTWKSTVDLWITQVIPSLIFSIVTGHYWIIVFYYIWAAFLQEELEHNKKINFYPFTAGQWHLVHHRTPNKNFGLFLPFWDKIFRTEKLMP